MARVHEVLDVAPERQTMWLAGQLDELDSALVKSNKELRAEVKEMSTSTTSEMSGIRKVLVALLVSVVGLLLTVSTGLAVFIIQGGAKP